jgi:hypothetical protein
MGIEEDGGSHIDDVERFDHMLPFAKRVSGNAGDIFESDLPAGHGRRALQRLMDRLATLGNPLMGFEETVNGLARGNRQLEELERRIVF